MAGSAGDRVTINLRGIGDAVRSTAAGRGLTIAAFAREALVGALSDAPSLHELADAPAARRHGTVKLTWRMDVRAAEALAANARTLGLSYGQYVGYLVSTTPLPTPATQRAADRAALQASTHQLAELALSMRDLVRFLRQGDVEEARKYRSLLDTIGGDVERHLDRASRLLSMP
jgi:hypothetical protein